MLGLIPVGRKLVRDRNDEALTEELERPGWFEPGAEGVLRDLASRAFEKATPNFLRREIHAVWKSVRGAEGIGALWKSQRAVAQCA